MSPIMRRAQRGQSLVETIIVLPAFLLLVLGTLQAILFYRAKATVDYAALMAAREGATNFAQMGPMKTGLERGLMPLYTHEPTRAGAIKGFARAKADVTARGATIQIISPTQAMFDRWKEAQYDGVEGIPNDSLNFRDGEQAGVTIQDANVLKIRVTYYYPLIVPLINRMIGEKRPVLSADGTRIVSRWVLPIQAQAIARMQTPIRDRSLLASSTGPGGGSGGGGGSGPPGGGDPPGGGSGPPGGGSPPGGGGVPPGGIPGPVRGGGPTGVGDPGGGLHFGGGEGGSGGATGGGSGGGDGGDLPPVPCPGG